jgi:hypothetical protein
MATEGKGPIVIPCYLVDGVPYVLEVDANGKLAMRAVELETLLAGGLPAALDSGALKVKEQSPLTGFATSANQLTEITALQLIDDLRNALLTVAADRLGVRATELETLLAGGLPAALDSGALKVKEQATLTVQATGSDKIFSLESIVEQEVYKADLSGASPQVAGTAVGAGKLWVITAVSFLFRSTTVTRVTLGATGLASTLILLDQASPTANHWYTWTGKIILQVADYMSLDFTGGSGADDAWLRYAGYQMDAP